METKKPEGKYEKYAEIREINETNLESRTR